MQSPPEIIEYLNEALTAELTAINQYFLHAKLCNNWGYERLGHKFRDESIDEMRHAEKVIDRIILLDGMPNLQRLGNVIIGETVAEQIRLARDAEISAVEMYRNGIRLCLELGDPGTRELLEDIVVEEEEHLDWLDTQLGLIEDLGTELYLQAQMHD